MNIGTVGQAVTAQELQQISGDFVRFGIAVDDDSLPKSVYADDYLQLIINNETIRLGLTGIYEVDHPIHITSINLPEYHYQTVSGNPINFVTAGHYPIQDFLVDIQGYQEPNNYETCWIGGTDKNLFNGTLYNGQIDSSGNWLASEARLSNANNSADYSFPIVAGTYTLSAQNSDLTRCTLLTKNSDGNIIDNYANTWQTLPLTFTVTQDSYLFFTLRANNTQQTLAPINYTTVQVERGNVATEWRPYENICAITSYDQIIITQTGNQTNVHQIDLNNAGHIYKGTLNINTGELIVNWVEADLGNVHWSYQTTSQNFWSNTLTNIKTVLVNDKPYLLSDHYTTVTWAELNNYAFAISMRAEVSQLRIRDARYSNVTDFQNAVRGYKIAYQLAEPIVYHLTPRQLFSLVGQNQLQSNSGNMTLRYRSDDAGKDWENVIFYLDYVIQGEE